VQELTAPGQDTGPGEAAHDLADLALLAAMAAARTGQVAVVG
jgi:hypothetical protein